MPDIRIRVVNVVDLMAVVGDHRGGKIIEQPASIRTGWRIRTSTSWVIFAFHGYPAMIHKLTYRRRNHDNIHVSGTARRVVLNNLDRYQLALDAIRRIPRLSDQVETATARYWSTMERHKLYISEHGRTCPE